MSTVIFKWNPAISSYTIPDYFYEMRRLAMGKPAVMNWSVWHHDRVQPADCFYWLRVGEGQPCGIVGYGGINSRPYLGKDWSGRGRRVYYVDFLPEVLLPLDGDFMLSADVLEKEIPDFNWRGGASGLVLTHEQAEKLDELWRKHILGQYDNLVLGGYDAYLDVLTEEEIYLDERMKIEICQEYKCLNLVQYLPEEDVKRVISIHKPKDEREALGLATEQELYDYVKAQGACPDGIENLATDLLKHNVNFDFYTE